MIRSIEARSDSVMDENLPHEVHYQCVWLVRDLSRLSEIAEIAMMAKSDSPDERVSTRQYSVEIGLYSTEVISTPVGELWMSDDSDNGEAGTADSDGKAQAAIDAVLRKGRRKKKPRMRGAEGGCNEYDYNEDSRESEDITVAREEVIRHAVFVTECVREALDSIPEEFRTGILENIINKTDFNTEAHSNTWKRWKKAFLYRFAFNLGLI